MDIPAIQVVKSSDSSVDDGLLLSEACELYLRLKGVGRDYYGSDTPLLSAAWIF